MNRLRTVRTVAAATAIRPSAKSPLNPMARPMRTVRTQIPVPNLRCGVGHEQPAFHASLLWRFPCLHGGVERRRAGALFAPSGAPMVDRIATCRPRFDQKIVEIRSKNLQKMLENCVDEVFHHRRQIDQRNAGAAPAEIATNLGKTGTCGREGWSNKGSKGQAKSKQLLSKCFGFV